MNILDNENKTVLYTAICKDNLDIVKLLVIHNADVNNDMQKNPHSHTHTWKINKHLKRELKRAVKFPDKKFPTSTIC